MDLHNVHKVMREARFHHGNHPPPLVYSALGLAGETGEVVEKIKKACRDDNYPFEELTSERQVEIEKELGDVLFYLTCVAEDSGTNLDKVMARWMIKFEGRKNRGTLHGDGDDR